MPSLGRLGKEDLRGVRRRRNFVVIETRKEGKKDLNHKKCIKYHKMGHYSS